MTLALFWRLPKCLEFVFSFFFSLILLLSFAYRITTYSLSRSVCQCMMNKTFQATKNLLATERVDALILGPAILQVEDTSTIAKE